MASLRKLQSGRWNVQIRRRGYPVISKTFSTKADAEKWLRKVESDIEREVFIDRSRAESTTLGDALTRYLSEITPTKKGAVKETYRIKTWLKHPYSARSLASLKSADFSLYRDVRLQQVSPASVTLELGVISQVFNVASKDWSIEGITNPIEKIRKPRINNARNRRLSRNEADRLLMSCRQSRSASLYYLVVVALETAMRLGEMMTLTWSQVDFKNRYLKLYDTKNGDDREVPLSMRALEALSDVKHLCVGDRVFSSWVRSDSVKKSWKTALKSAGIEDFRFHDLRHEATSRLFEKGLNPIEVASITGHKSMQMLRRYTHPRVSELVKKLGD